MKHKPYLMIRPGLLSGLSTALLLAVLACNIIRDDDIQDAADFPDLRLTTINVKQNTSTSNSDHTATVLADTATSIEAGAGNIVNRVVWYSLPNLSASKLKYRSGVSSNLRAYLSYIDNDKPFTFVVYQGDSAVEIYRFRYDASGNLNRIIIDINPVDDLPLLYQTNDLITYAGQRIVSVERSSTNEDKAGTFRLDHQQGAFPDDVARITFQNITLRPAFSNCPNGIGCWAYFYEIQAEPNTSESTISTVNVNRNVQLGNLSNLTITDVKLNNGNGGGTCCFDYDTYYFHPLMLLMLDVPNGENLLKIHMVDWWEPGPLFTGPANFTINEFVAFNFIYER